MGINTNARTLAAVYIHTHTHTHTGSLGDNLIYKKREAH